MTVRNIFSRVEKLEARRRRPDDLLLIWRLPGAPVSEAVADARFAKRRAITTAAEAADTMSAILAAVAGGEITPAEASEIAKLVDSYVRAVEATELAARIERLERMTSQ